MLKVMDVVLYLARITIMAAALFAGMAQASSHWCAASGQVRASCCCPKTPTADDCGRVQMRPSCCSVEAGQPVAPSAPADPTGAMGASVLVVDALPESPLSLLSLADVAWRHAARGPPMLGPPAFLQHCALLI